MTYTDNYLDATADGISEMHVIIEGAIAIFESDVDPLIRLATQHKEYEARMALNDIGTALYVLRMQIQKLQAALIRESERQIAARMEVTDHD